MSDSNLFKKVAAHVTQLYEEYHHPNLVFHNIEHTRDVVRHAQEIAAHYPLSDRETLVLYTAAWFHDTGHLFAELATHEDKSVELMRTFMERAFMEQEGTTDESLAAEIEATIMATRMPHQPKNLVQEIICDADTYHFGTTDFKSTNKKVKKEYELRNFTAATYEWEKHTLELLQRHQFFTTYCKAMLQEGKEANIRRMQKKYLKVAHNQTHSKLFDGPEEEKKNQTGGTQTGGLITRGIQTMLRLTSENHLELSNMADGKANILISVNSIIISVILGVLVRRLEVDRHLTIPTIIFLTFSVTTIVISILATRPKITEGRFSREDIMSKRTNLLFFGNFHKSSLEEYEWAMGSMMRDKDYLYGSLVRDIHQLGVVLGRKYRFIRLAYNVFMTGIVISVIAFTLAVILKNPEQVTTITATPTEKPF